MNDQGFRCQEVENSLPLFVGGDLEPEARAAVGRHLADCAYCRASARRAMRARVALIGACSDTERAADLWPGVRAALLAEGLIRSGDVALARGPRGPRGPRGIGSRRRIGAWGATWAAAAAALLIGFWLGRPGSPVGDIRHEVHRIPDVADAAGVPATPPLVAETAEPGSRGQPLVGPGLRRLVPGEAALSDSAEIYVPDLPWSSHPLRRETNAGSPASLETVRPIH